MASPAAVLSVLVKADGIARTNSQIQSLHGDLGKSSKAALRMGDDLDKGSRKGSKALGALKSGAGLAIGALGAVGLAGAVKTAVGEFEEARKVGANTNQVIKSTGGAAKISAKQVAELSTSISKKAGIDDEAIQSGANLLLTFKNIRNETGKGKDIFNQATKAAVDLSAAGFGSLSSTSKQLGKALNDPVKGMTALGKSGVTFSEDQKKAIEALLKTGKAADRVKAQQIILREVQSQVGGQAAAQATTMDKLKVTLGNLAEAAGAVLVPALDKVGRFLVKVINQMIEGKGTGGAIISTFRNVAGVFGGVVAAGAKLIAFFKENKTLTMALAAAVGVFAVAYTATLIPALIASTAAVIAQVAAWVALRIAFLASPIGMIVTGIALLAAGLVVAYQKSETFRNIINAMWQVIKTVAAWLVTAGVAAFKALASAVSAAWGVVKTVTATVWNGLKTFLVPLWGLLKTLITTYFNGYKTVVVTVWNAIKTVTTTIWGAIKTVATTVWGALKTAATIAWDGIKVVVLTPIRAARDALGGIWGAIKDTAEKAWDGIKKGLSGFAKSVKDGILDGIKGGLNALIGFVNSVIGVINSIPGVPNIKKIDKLAEGGVVGKDGVQALAQGGIVRKPIVMMGEEAPRHPEYVIPTNPAYRSRAQMLLGKAAGAIGYKVGGVFDSTSYGPPWTGINGTGITAAGVNLQSSPHIHGIAVDPSVVPMGWLGKIWPNPFQTRAAFQAFDTGSAIKGRRIDFYDWRGRDAQFGWGSRQVRLGDGAVNPSGGKILSNLADALNPMDFIKKLPGLDDLPGWLKGTGKYVLGHATDYIKNAVTGIFGSGDAQDRVRTMITKGNQIDALNGPYEYGGGRNPIYEAPYDCSGLVSTILHAGGLLNGVLDTVGLSKWGEAGDGKYVTVGVRGGAGMSGHTMMKIGNRYIESGSGHGAKWVDGWSGNFPIHRHPPGFAKGGVFGPGAPFVGSYARGGVVPSDGLGYLHQGETVVPRGAGGPLVHIAHMEIREETDVARVARSLAWQLETGMA